MQAALLAWLYAANLLESRNWLESEPSRTSIPILDSVSFLYCSSVFLTVYVINVDGGQVDNRCYEVSRWVWVRFVCSMSMWTTPEASIVDFSKYRQGY